MFDPNIERKIISDWRMPLGGTIYGAVFLFLLHVALAPLTHSTEKSNSLQKRKDAIFKLADRLGELKNPTKSDVERMIGRKTWSKSAGWYTSDSDKTQDIDYFLVPYDGQLKITRIWLVINDKFDIGLKDVVRNYGKWNEILKSPYDKENMSKQSISYCYDKKKVEKIFEFDIERKHHLNLIKVTPSTTPTWKTRP